MEGHGPSSQDAQCAATGTGPYVPCVHDNKLYMLDAIYDSLQYPLLDGKPLISFLVIVIYYSIRSADHCTHKINNLHFFYSIR